MLVENKAHNLNKKRECSKNWQYCFWPLAVHNFERLNNVCDATEINDFLNVFVRLYSSTYKHLPSFRRIL